MVEVHQTDDVVKSKSDKRRYKLIKLENQMRCLLIQDDEADKSAASLNVNVGCALDPKEFYGTAHFLEHMLFMGTEKYPDENEYSEYIKNNGGYNNAFTSLTETNYHFETSNEGFERALDMFAQFFIAPILGESSTEREMKAIDSEFNMSQQNDAWRKFINKPGIRETLLEFHKKWYSSNIMDLVITGKHSLE